MNKSFNHFIKNILLISLGLLALSALLVFSYMESKGLNWNDLIEDGHFYFSSKNNDSNPLDLRTNLSLSSKSYDLLDIYHDDTFKLVDNITLNTTLEDIVFVHEDRQDIRVVFERQVPDTKSYSINYKARSTNDALIVDVDLKTSGFYADQSYDGLITLYLPLDYHCDTLSIDSTIASNTLLLPNSMDHLDVDINFGSLDLTCHEALKSLKLSVNAGDLSFVTKASVDWIKANVDTGELSFDVYDHVDELKATNNIGSISGYLGQSPDNMTVSSNLGDITLEFSKPIHTLTTSLNVGDIDIDVSENDLSKVFIDSNLVEFTSHLDQTQSRSSANIFLDMNLGEVTIH